MKNVFGVNNGFINKYEKSNFTVIGDIGETLKKLLEDDPWEGMAEDSKPEIIMKSPKEVGEEGTLNNKVSIFLYHIHINPYLRNQEPPVTNDTAFKIPPLVLDLNYMVTPYSEDKTDEKYNPIYKLKNGSYNGIFDSNKKFIDNLLLNENDNFI